VREKAAKAPPAMVTPMAASTASFEQLEARGRRTLGRRMAGLPSDVYNELKRLNAVKLIVDKLSAFI
jgi:hypothetical protein